MFLSMSNITPTSTAQNVLSQLGSQTSRAQQAVTKATDADGNHDGDTAAQDASKTGGVNGKGGKLDVQA